MRLMFYVSVPTQRNPSLPGLIENAWLNSFQNVWIFITYMSNGEMFESLFANPKLGGRSFVHCQSKYHCINWTCKN